MRTVPPEVKKATHKIAFDVTKSHDLSQTASQVPGSESATGSQEKKKKKKDTL